MILPKLKQYGIRNSVKRGSRKILRIFGIDWETYYLLKRDLNKEINSKEPMVNCTIRELTPEILKKFAIWKSYKNSKKELLLWRLKNKRFKGYGCFVNEKLVYSTWIENGFIRIERIGYEKKLEKKEWAFLDSFALPAYRQLGIHSYMTSCCLKKTKELGASKVYVVLLKENLPAIRTQVRHGFISGDKIKFLRFFKWNRIMVKPIFNFSEEI